MSTIFGASYGEPDETPEEYEIRMGEKQQKIEQIVASVLEKQPTLVTLWTHSLGRLVGEAMVQNNLPAGWIQDVQKEMLAKLAKELGIDDG